MYVVDDILFAQIVVPYGRRLLARSRDTLYTWLDQQLGKQGKKLVKHWGKNKPSEDEILRDLGRFTEQHPGTAGTLTTAVLATELAAPSPLHDEEFLKLVRDYFLTPIVGMVQALNRPAVLPGLVTGAGYLTAVDVRTPSTGAGLEKPWIRGEIDDKPAEMVLSMPLGYGNPRWMPRFWIIKAAFRKECEALALDPSTTIQGFAEALKDQSFVTGITRQHVIGHASSALKNFPPLPKHERQLLPWAQDPGAIAPMRAALEKQLGQRLEQDRLWIRALSNPISPYGPPA